MRSVTGTRFRWRIMIGLGTDKDGAPIDPKWARETALDAANGLEAFNITDGIGTWRGKQEPSLVIEYIGRWEDDGTVRGIARKIAVYLDQEEVWVSQEVIKLTRVLR